jgi:hypothetical protein
VDIRTPRDLDMAINRIGRVVPFRTGDLGKPFRVISGRLCTLPAAAATGWTPTELTVESVEDPVTRFNEETGEYENTVPRGHRLTVHDSTFHPTD